MTEIESKHDVHTKREVATYARRTDRIPAKVLRRYPAFTTDMANAGLPEAAPLSQEDLAATSIDGNDRPRLEFGSHPRQLRPEIRSIASALVEAERSSPSGGAVRYYDRLHTLIG